MTPRTALLLASVAASLACGGLPARGPDNVGACVRYAEHVNALPCAVGALDRDEFCPPALDASPCDLRPYYACLARETRCDGDHLDAAGQGACAAFDCNPAPVRSR